MEEIDIAKGDPCVFSLSTRKSTSEMGVSKHADVAATVNCILNRVGVGAFALGGKLLLAIHALATGNLEGCNKPTTRSPTLTFLIAWPTESTIPQNSCPRMSPFCSSTITPAKYLRLEQVPQTKGRLRAHHGKDASHCHIWCFQ